MTEQDVISVTGKSLWEHEFLWQGARMGEEQIFGAGNGEADPGDVDLVAGTAAYDRDYPLGCQEAPDMSITNWNCSGQVGKTKPSLTIDVIEHSKSDAKRELRELLAIATKRLAELGVK